MIEVNRAQLNSQEYCKEPQSLHGIKGSVSNYDEVGINLNKKL